tara:strand:- start:4617 stop:7355 length:2739 start_codon:yes stop_codon:yes gene_type:complete
MTNDNLDIVLNPSELSEAASQTAVVTFGRMNPPTVGHLALVNKMLRVSQQKKAKPLIYLSHSVDSKKNPLSYNDKAKLINMAFGRIVQKSNAKNIFDMLKELSGNYKNLVIVVGSDRVKDLKRISTTYNGKDFNFENIEVVSAGTRDPDSDGVTGMSATKMRDAAAKNDVQAFKRGLPNQLNKYADKILKMVREGMNLKEDLDNIFEEHLDEAGVLTVAGRRKKAIAARRYKARLKVARRRVARRIAQTGRIKKRTARAAIRVMRNRIAGARGKSYTKLSPQEKASIDRRVRSRGNIVKKLATRIMPVTRRKEFARFKSFRTRKEAMDMAFSSYLTENNHKENKPIAEKVLNSIIKKSISAEIPVNILSEVYNKYRDHGDSFAYNRLNEFINKNKSSSMDEVFESFLSELDEGIMDNLKLKAQSMNPFAYSSTRNKAATKLRMNKKVDKIIKRGKENAAKRNPEDNKDPHMPIKRMNETKGAPKGYHFTRSGQLKKGDAGQDGDGGKMLRSDPLDKQRNKIPKLPEAYAPVPLEVKVDFDKKRAAKEKANKPVKEGMMDDLKDKVKASPLNMNTLSRKRATAKVELQKRLKRMDKKPKMEEVNAKDTEGLKKLSKGLTGSVKAHLKQKKELDKLIQNEAKVKNCGCGKDPCETYGSKEQQMQEIAQSSTIDHMLKPAKNVKVKMKNVALEGIEHIEEKNKPTKPALWSKFKSQAKAKFDVYPSAYANGWAAKKYKAAGGGWKSVKEENLDEISSDTIASYSAKAKKQRNDAEYDRDSYRMSASSQKSKGAMDNKLGLAKQKDNVAMKRSKGLGLANRRLIAKGKKHGLQDYDQRQKEREHNEEYGGGFIGTDALRQKYMAGTPGQTQSRDLAIDGVPGKGGMIPPQQPLKGLGQSGKLKVTSYKDFLNAKKS